MTGDSVTLSIIIVNWNTCEFLIRALRSIYDSPSGFSFEVIIVDNASADDSPAVVSREFPQAIVIANQENRGYAAGNNQGIAASKGKYLLLLNPDVIVTPVGPRKAVAILDRRPDVAALGVRLVGADGITQRSVRGFPTPWAVFCEAVGLSRLFPNSRFFAGYRMGWFKYDREAEVDQPMGTYLMIPRKVWDEVGPLDEQFPIFFNEVDWCYRAKKAGWNILFTPEAQVLHFGGASTGQVSAKMAWESRQGLLRFYRKHFRSPLFAPVYWLATLTSWIHTVWVARQRRK